MQVDIAMTATRRPEILRRTLTSFTENFFGTTDDFRLIINIDPVGLDIDSNEVVAVCREFFDNLIVNCPGAADYNTAFRYTYGRCESEIMFHLEDDWIVPYPVDMKKMLQIMIDNPDLALLCLSAFPSGGDSLSRWDVYQFPWNGQFFECPKNHRRKVGSCGHPAFISRKFITKTLPLMGPRHNPEAQFHVVGPIAEIVVDWRFGVFIEPNSPPNVVDIGREWMDKNGWQKNSDKTHTVWNRTR